MASTKIDLDQLDEFQNVLATITDGQGIVWNNSTEKFIPANLATGVFGDNFNEYEVDGIQSTSSEIFQNYLTFVTPTLPAGNYIIYVGYIANTTASNVSVEIRTQLDGIDIFPENFRQYGGNTSPVNERLYPAHFEVVPLNGIHTITVDFRRQGNNKVVNIYHAHVVLWRVS
jgi:hypothetical protein